MAVISFEKTPERIWLSAKWAFSRFIADLRKEFADEPAAAYRLEAAEALEGLHLDLVAEKDTALANRIKQKIIEIASATLQQSSASRAWQEGLDIQGQSMYLDGMKELLTMAKTYPDYK